jgi:hypothetical protein
LFSLEAGGWWPRLPRGSVVRILRGDAIIDPGTQERLAALDR